MILNKDIDNKYILDWIELYVALNGSISKTDILGEFTNIDEDYVEDIFFKLGNRLFLYGSKEPYSINGDIITTNLITDDFKKNSYVFSLFLSVYGNGFKTNEGGKNFERLSNEAFRKYLGGESIVLGFPDGSTGGLKKRIDDLATSINEKRGCQDPLISAKDDKLDLISYKTIDSRENKIIFLIQSAAGGNWKEKLSELSIEKWSYYINFGIKPIRGFSTSTFIDDKGEFYNRGMAAGLIFDRPRIYRFISEIVNFEDITLDADLIDWNKNAIINYS